MRPSVPGTSQSIQGLGLLPRAELGIFLFPTAKTASVRALLFDISFLMLCHVAQTYGSEVSDECW